MYLKSALVSALFAAVSFSQSAAATTWDADADFTPTSITNPNGVWSYGYDPAAVAGYQMKLFDNYVNSSWGDQAYSISNTPLFWRDENGQISLHPGQAANDDAAILRFTAPVTTNYIIASQFFSGNTGETDARVIKNGNLGSPLASLGSTNTNPMYSTPSLYLAAGDTLDFVVGNRGDYGSDATPLSVSISAVPEPQSLLLLLAGLPLLVMQLKRRR